MRVDATIEASFVAGTHGRDARIALWSSDAGGEISPGESRSGERSSEISVAFADGVRSVPADVVTIAEAVPTLANLSAATETTDSMRALSVGTRLALDLVSRGRLLPAISADGADMWRLGPLDTADRKRLDQLAAALPAAAYTALSDDTGNESPGHGGAGRESTSYEGAVPTPTATVAALLEAVADSFVRTSSAPAASGSQAFAAPDAVTDVTAVESWLQSVTAGVAGQSVAGLRIEGPRADNDAVRGVIQIQSGVDPSLVLDAETLWSAPTSVLSRFGPEVETDLLLTLRRAARAWAPIERLLAMATPDVIELDDDEVEELFGPVADDLAAAGLSVMWPSEVFRPLEMRPVLDTPQPDSVAKGRLDLSALGEIRWHATVDGGELTEAELLELSQAKRPVVRLRGKWVRADPDRLARLNERKPVAAGDVLAAALGGTINVEGRSIEAELTTPLAALASRLATIDAATSLEPPDTLDATLRPYQKRGLSWLAEMTSLGLGGVLADDMGLGKTIQILALHLLRHADDGVVPRRSTGQATVVDSTDQVGPTLVVCPATLLGNWEREAQRFAPDVPVIRYHGPNRSLAGVGRDHIVVATYGVVRRDAAVLGEVAWDLVVADEAQAIKNPMSRTARAIRSIASHARIALTGTPVENRLSDLWALLDWTTPGLLGPLDPFQRNVATPIERDKDPEATERLAAIVRPFLLRRRKSDPEIAPDLPPKTETDRFVGITVEQATLYKAVVDEMLDDVAESDDEFSRQGQVLKLLTALKQICNHPAQYLDQPGPLAGRSGKLDAVAELLSVIVDEGDSVLLFTQYVRMGHLLVEHLGSLGIESQFLHGSVPVRRREAMVDAFQAGDPRVFVISLGAGGTGLNLTRATHVVHYDRWWNPAVEDQASDRAWRIGQDRPVQVHRMICEGTLEERVAKVLEQKRLLADSVVGGGEAWVSQLSNDELAALVSLGDGF